MNGSGKKDFIDAEGQDTGSGLGSFVLRVAIKTLLVFFVIFSLAATIVGCLFPKVYMDVYRSLGLYGKASAYAAAAADRAADTHGPACDGTCGYAALLTDGISLASIAYSEDASETHLRRLYDFTDAYLALDCHEKRSAMKDATYLKVYGERGLAQLSVLYGYDDYVCGEYFRADLLLRGSDACTRLETALNADIAAANAEVLNMIAAYFDYDHANVQSSRTDPDAPLMPYSFFFEADRYSRLLDVYGSYIAVAASLTADTLDVKAQKASLLLRLWNLAETCDIMEEFFVETTADTTAGDREFELARLVRKDTFNKEETARVRGLYTAAVGGKAAA